MRFHVILATLILGSCCQTPISTNIGTPSRPQLIPLTQEQWDRLPPDVQDIVDYNDRELKRYASKLEARIKAHNEAL